MDDIYAKSPHRSRLEILADVLKAAKVEAKPTRIMYHANLSWISLQRALRTLLAKGLLTVRSSSRGRRYTVTSEGD